MQRIEDLKISPFPWEHRQNSGYDEETGEFNTSDSVHDANGEALTDWWNGETYGEINPNAEADARLIAAAPKMYEALRETIEYICRDCVHHAATIDGDKLKDEECMLREPCKAHEWRAVLAEASGEVVC